MKSMTGYGVASGDFKNYEISIDIASVNRRNLETSIYLPKDWLQTERTLLKTVQEKVERGKVNVYIKISPREKPPENNTNEQAVIQHLEKLKILAEKVNVPFSPDLQLLNYLLKNPETEEPPLTEEESKEAVFNLFNEALEAFIIMRITEGTTLANDIKERIQSIKDQLKLVEELSTKTPLSYKEQLEQRLRQLGLEIDIQDERVLKEIALFADRCDIAEEITRLKSHFDMFLETISEEGRIGRKLDFICQEIFRELNTAGNKANNIEISKIIVEAKNELERIREQVQNIE